MQWKMFQKKYFFLFCSLRQGDQIFNYLWAQKLFYLLARKPFGLYLDFMFLFGIGIQIFLNIKLLPVINRYIISMDWFSLAKASYTWSKHKYWSGLRIMSKMKLKAVVDRTYADYTITYQFVDRNRLKCKFFRDVILKICKSKK